MIDYEYRITVAEKELAHLREMQALARAHREAHDQPFAAVATRMERIEDNLDKATAILKDLSVAQKVTEQKFQGLIDILVREHSNGKLGRQG